MGGTRGYMETPFQGLVQYSTGIINPSEVITDTLAGCRLSSDEDSHSESADGLTVSCDLDIMYILKNGLSALSPEQLLR